MSKLFLCLVWIPAAFAFPVKDIGEKQGTVLDLTEKRGDANNERLSQMNISYIVEKMPKDETLRILNASRQTRTTLDEHDKEGISESGTGQKDVEEALDDELAELSEPYEQSMKATFKKRARDNKTGPCDSSVRLVLEKLFRSISPPSVTVQTALYSLPDGPSNLLDVPLVPDMSVLRALIFAARDFKGTHKEVPDAMNPYNAALRWEDEMDCYVIVKLLGLESDAYEYWEVAVLSADDEIKYQDRCLPYEDKIVLRSRDQVCYT